MVVLIRVVLVVCKIMVGYSDGTLEHASAKCILVTGSLQECLRECGV